MKKSTKAALLSGLVFPGIGHMVLKQYLRGSVLLFFTLIAVSIIMTAVYQRALAVVDRVLSGDVPAETGAIADAISNSTGGTTSPVESLSLIVLVVCWLVGIIDSYRLGIAQEKQHMSA